MPKSHAIHHSQQWQKVMASTTLNGKKHQDYGDVETGLDLSTS